MSEMNIDYKNIHFTDSTRHNPLEQEAVFNYINKYLNIRIILVSLNSPIFTKLSPHTVENTFLKKMIYSMYEEMGKKLIYILSVNKFNSYPNSANFRNFPVYEDIHIICSKIVNFLCQETQIKLKQ